MFCFNSCIEKPIVKHKVLYVDNDSELIINSKKLVKEFLKSYNKTGNFWKRISVMENPTYTGADCFGNYVFGLNHITEEENKINFKDLFLKGYNFLNQYGFNVKLPEDLDNERDVLIEIHYANSITKPVETDLVVHCDNNKYIDGDLHTLLVFVDIDCEGGELDIYDHYGHEIIKTIKPKSEDNTRTKCVLLTGNCYHYPNKVLSGKRILVSYQFRKYNNVSDFDEE